MASLAQKGKEGWWSLAGKPSQERLVNDEEEDEEENQGAQVGVPEAKPNKLVLARAHFHCSESMVEVEGQFYVLQPCFEYCFHGLYKNTSSTKGFSVFDTEKSEYRPKLFTPELLLPLVRNYAHKSILQAWIQRQRIVEASALKAQLLQEHEKKLEDAVQDLLENRDVLRYLWYDELQLLEQYYSRAVREYLLHNLSIHEILRLHALFHSGSKLERLCFHATKCKLPDGSKLRRLPELKYDSFSRVPSNRANPMIRNAVSIYHEILRIDVYGHKQSDLFDRSKKLLYKPINHGHLYTEYGIVQKHCRDQQHCEDSLGWLQKKGVTVEPGLELADFKHMNTRRHIYLSSIWATQKRLIQQLTTLVTRWEEDGEEAGMTLRAGGYSKRSNRGLNPLQQAAVQAALDNPISIITGRGGTGKTEAVKDVVDHYGSDDPEANTVLFAGPTGRSAVNITRRVMQAYTLDKIAHTLRKAIRLEQQGKLDLKKEEQEEETGVDTSAASRWDWYLNMTPQEHRVALEQLRQEEFVTLVRRWKRGEALIIDEMSMVDLEKLEFLLRVLIHFAPLKKLVLLGDVQQLQSIAAGRVMNDLIMAFPHAVTRLKTNMRNPSSTIFHNASVCMAEGKNKQLRYDDSFVLIPAQKQSDIEMLVRSFFARLKREARFQPSQVHFIAFRRQQVAQLNKACRPFYTQHYEARSDGRADRPEFFVGERIYFKKNNYTQGVMNGQIWTILRYVDVMQNGGIREGAVSNLDVMRGSTVTRVAVLRSEEDQDTIISIDLQDIPFNFKNVSLGYATTIHKFQGTEKEVIVYCLKEDHFLENASHVYTAWTRSTSCVYNFSNQHTIQSTMKRPVPLRRSQLTSLLLQEMEGSDEEEEDSSSEEEEEKSAVKRQKQKMEESSDEEEDSSDSSDEEEKPAVKRQKRRT